MKRAGNWLLLPAAFGTLLAAQAADMPLSQPDHGDSVENPAGELSADARLVTWDYDPNRSYPVRTRVRAFTEIVVPEGEKIVSYFPSADEKRGWPYVISGDKRRVLVMPMAADSENSATLVTDRRSYLLTFRSSATGLWYQRVRWIVPEEAAATLPDLYGLQGDAASHDSAQAGTDSGPDLENMSVDYTISGDADFAPTLVADDGRFTWFRLPPDTQELPALFVLDADGKAELVSYTVDANQTIRAQRTAEAWLLKLGDEEVHVTAGKKKKTGGLFGWFK